MSAPLTTVTGQAKEVFNNDMYEGPLDLAPFGRPVVGPLSSDALWMINPQSYDPTRPSISDQQKAEMNGKRQELPTPQSTAAVFGHFSTAATDVDIGMMAELGAAVTRGAAELSSQPQSRTGDDAQDHHSRPVPDSAPS